MEKRPLKLGIIEEGRGPGGWTGNCENGRQSVFSVGGSAEVPEYPLLLPKGRARIRIPHPQRARVGGYIGWPLGGGLWGGALWGVGGRRM